MPHEERLDAAPGKLRPAVHSECEGAALGPIRQMRASRMCDQTSGQPGAQRRGGRIPARDTVVPQEGPGENDALQTASLSIQKCDLRYVLRYLQACGEQRAVMTSRSGSRALQWQDERRTIISSARAKSASDMEARGSAPSSSRLSMRVWRFLVSRTARLSRRCCSCAASGKRPHLPDFPEERGCQTTVQTVHCTSEVVREHASALSKQGTWPHHCDHCRRYHEPTG